MIGYLSTYFYILLIATFLAPSTSFPSFDSNFRENLDEIATSWGKHFCSQRGYKFKGIYLYGQKEIKTKAYKEDKIEIKIGIPISNSIPQGETELGFAGVNFTWFDNRHSSEPTYCDYTMKDLLTKSISIETTKELTWNVGLSGTGGYQGSGGTLGGNLGRRHSSTNRNTHESVNGDDKIYRINVPAKTAVKVQEAFRFFGYKMKYQRPIDISGCAVLAIEKEWEHFPHKGIPACSQCNNVHFNSKGENSIPIARIILTYLKDAKENDEPQKCFYYPIKKLFTPFKGQRSHSNELVEKKGRWTIYPNTTDGGLAIYMEEGYFRNIGSTCSVGVTKSYHVDKYPLHKTIQMLQREDEESQRQEEIDDRHFEKTQEDKVEKPD